MRHGLRVMAPLAERLRELRERRRGAPGERLATLARAQAPRIGHRPLELVAHGGIREVVQHEFVRLAHAVGPVGADPEPHHVRDDQQRRILKRQRVLAQLIECRAEVSVLALVLPRETVPLPHVGPTVAASILAGAALEAIAVASRIGFGRRWLAEQPAEVDEVLLRRRAFLELRRPPFGDELTRCHGVSHTGLNAPWGHSAPPGTAPRPRSRRGFRPTNEPPICSCVGLEVEQLDAIAVTAKIPAIEGQETPLAVGQHGRDDVRIVNLTTRYRHRAA